MATSRTKIDWAYHQAKRIVNSLVPVHPVGGISDDVRRIAGILRKAYRRGRSQGTFEGTFHKNSTAIAREYEPMYPKPHKRTR